MEVTERRYPMLRPDDPPGTVGWVVLGFGHPTEVAGTSPPGAPGWRRLPSGALLSWWHEEVTGLSDSDSLVLCRRRDTASPVWFDQFEIAQVGEDFDLLAK